MWRFEPDAPPEAAWAPVTPPVKTSNGLAWSPDGKTMYHSDTEPKVIWAWDYDEATGTAENRRVFAQVEVEDTRAGRTAHPSTATASIGAPCSPTAACCDSTRTGSWNDACRMPVKYPTMPAFGGPDLKTLYVTSAAYPFPPEERDRHPLEGGLFAMEAPAAGLPSTLFNPSR